MEILKKKSFWLMLFIVILGAVLRLAYINKPDGLWNDEYVSWYIASIPIGKHFMDAVFTQCHMPFYYLYLKFFIHFFGNSDLMLRLTSVPAGILSIISMYFVGKEFKDEKLGILCASLTSLSSFLIYFSQEVRFYGILFLFTSLALLFTLKLIKTQKAINIVFYVIFNALILFTHTIGFIFVILNLIFVSLYLIKERHAEFISASSQLSMLERSRGKFWMKIILWTSIFVLILFGSPLLFKVLTTNSQSQFWGQFTFSRLGFLITDYFSPVLTNIVSAPEKFFYDLSPAFFIFALVPSLIAIIGIVRALMTKQYKILGLFFVSLAFVLVLVLASIFGKMVFVTKYSIEIYPTLILLACYGLLDLKKVWRYFLVFLFCFLNMFYILTSPIGAPKIRRSEGNKIVANLLENSKLKDGDFILLTYYPKERFEKYFDFSKYQVFSINKGNFSKYLGVNSKNELKKIDGNIFDKKVNGEILSKLKSGKKLAIVNLNTVSGYSPIQLYTLFHNKKEYDKAPFVFLIFSYVKNGLLEEGLNHLQISRLEQKGSWSVITFTKK